MQQLSIEVTNIDIKTFHCLSPKDFIRYLEGDDNTYLNHLSDRWNDLSEVVQECVIANRENGHHMRELASVSKSVSDDCCIQTS